VVIDDDGTTQFTIIEADNYKEFQKKYKKASERVREGAQKMNDDIVQRLKGKGVVVDIEGAGKYKEEANQALQHLEVLLNEYNSTTVSYTVTSKNLTGDIAEGGAAYMLNGKTSIAVRPSAFKKLKATDSLRLGDNQPYGITYHEFAHSLSQSREKIDGEFWKEIRKIKREYEGERGKNSWFDAKISDYASKDVDEFLAEAFTQAKLSENPSPYSKQVLDIVDKYFGKKPLEKAGESSKLDLNLQLFSYDSSKYKTIKLDKKEYAHGLLQYHILFLGFHYEQPSVIFQYRLKYHQSRK